MQASSASSAVRFRQLDLALAAATVAVLLALATFVAWPVVRVLAASLTGPEGFTLARYGEFFGTWQRARILLQTLAVAASSTALTIAVGLVLADAVTRTDIPGKRLVSLTSLLPLIGPPFLASLALLLLFGRDGALTRALGLPGTIEGFHGIVAAQVLSFLPVAYLLVGNALGGIDPALEEAAENLGAGSLTTLRRVTLVLARPGLASAALVVFVLCLTDFGNPFLVGGRYRVLATEIYAEVVRANDLAAAATLSAILLLPCLAAGLLGASWIASVSSLRIPTAARSTRRPTPAVVRWGLGVVCCGIGLLVAAVYALIPLGSLVRRWGSDWSPSLQHYAFASMPGGVSPLWQSLRLALVAGVAGTAMALGTAYLIERRRGAAARAVKLLGLLPAALPGAVVGVGYLLAFGPPLFPTGTLWLLVASVVGWKLPVALLAAMSAVGKVAPALEEAAVSLGAGGTRTFARVVLPQLAGGASSVFVYFFVSGMVTVSAVVFLVSPGGDLASVAVLSRVAAGDLGVACALATVVLGVALGAVLLVRPLGGGPRVAGSGR